jgi:5-deoxy-glucuronate isomerase
MKRVSLALRRPGEQGIALDDPGWRHIAFRVHHLAAGSELAGDTGGCETALLLLGGHAEIDAAGRGWGRLGSRADPWAGGPPDGVLLPPGSAYHLRAADAVELAVCAAPAAKGVPPRRLDPGSARFELRGSGPTERRIHHILPEEAPAERLLLVEVFTPAGNWSSYPPHKHDVDDPPRERELAETYYHRVRPAQGFAFQRVYSGEGDLDATCAVRDGDLILVPRGYHVVAAAPGYDDYYLNVMAGPVREWRFTPDPSHAWLMNWGRTP